MAIFIKANQGRKNYLTFTEITKIFIDKDNLYLKVVK